MRLEDLHKRVEKQRWHQEAHHFASMGSTGHPQNTKHLVCAPRTRKKNVVLVCENHVCFMVLRATGSFESNLKRRSLLSSEVTNNSLGLGLLEDEVTASEKATRGWHVSKKQSKVAAKQIHLSEAKGQNRERSNER